MKASPAEIHLEITPSARVDLIDVRERLGDLAARLADYRRALYCSHHTTAGYLDQNLCARLEHDPDRLNGFLSVFQQIFPPGASYEHDNLDLRSELSDEQKRTEPKNADSHLAFISSGLRSCVTYDNRESTPVYFIDLDGVHEHGVRKRQTTVLGYQREVVVESLPIWVPVSSHPIDSVNLRDRRLGLYERLEEMVRRHGIDKGRIDVAVSRTESHAGLTVNEYETLLMKHDLAEVLEDPVRFMAEKGRSMLRDPRAIPHKTRNYAQYDFVRFLNETMDALGISESLLERMVARLMAFPAARFLRMKRSLSLLVSDGQGEGGGSIVHGTYQSPILVQWRKARAGSRRLTATLHAFD